MGGLANDAYLLELGKKARKVTNTLASLNSTSKNGAILAIAEELTANSATLLAANEEDVAAGREQGLRTILGTVDPE